MPFARWMGASTRANFPRHQDEASATCQLDAVVVVDTNYPRAKVTPKNSISHHQILNALYLRLVNSLGHVSFALLHHRLVALSKLLHYPSGHVLGGGVEG